MMRKEIATKIANYMANGMFRSLIDEKNTTEAIQEMATLNELQIIFEAIYYYNEHHTQEKDRFDVVCFPDTTVTHASRELSNDPVYLNYNTLYIATCQSNNDLEARNLARCSFLFGVTLFLQKYVLTSNGANTSVSTPFSTLTQPMLNEFESLSDAEKSKWYFNKKDNEYMNTPDLSILIANVSSCIWANRSTYEIHKKCPQLMRYYQEVFLPACQQYILLQHKEIQQPANSSRLIDHSLFLQPNSNYSNSVESATRTTEKRLSS